MVNEVNIKLPEKVIAINYSFRNALPQIIAVMVKNILLFAFGVTTGFPTILIPNLRDDNNPDEILHLSEEQVSWAGSITMVFVPIGCLASGFVSQSIGRRRAMQAVTAPFVTAWLIFHFSTEIYQIFIALSLTGLAGGLLEAPVLTYVAEITQPHLRGMLSATSSMSVILGVFVQFFLGTFLKWRTIALVSMSFPMFSCFFLFFIPESPYWLISKKRYDDARKSLAWLRGWTTEENVDAEYRELYATLSKVDVTPSKLDVLRNYTKKTFLKPFFLVTFAFFVSHFCGISPIQTYAVSIFKALNTPLDKYKATLILGSVELIGCIVCVCIIHRVGKRILTLSSGILSGLLLLLLASYSHTIGIRDLDFDPQQVFNASQEHSGEKDIRQTLLEMNWIPTALLIIIAFLFHLSIRLLPWVLIGEVYPNSCRSGASGLSGISSYVIAFIANKLFLNMINLMTFPGVFWFFGGVILFGCFAFYFILPETEGKTLNEIELHFAGVEKMNNKVKRKEKVKAGVINEGFNGVECVSNENFESKL